MDVAMQHKTQAIVGIMLGSHLARW